MQYAASCAHVLRKNHTRTQDRPDTQTCTFINTCHTWQADGSIHATGPPYRHRATHAPDRHRLPCLPGYTEIQPLTNVLGQVAQHTVSGHSMKQPLALARREGGQRRRLSGKFGGSRQTTTNFFVAKELMADGILMHLCICNSSAIIQPICAHVSTLAT